MEGRGGGGGGGGGRRVDGTPPSSVRFCSTNAYLDYFDNEIKFARTNVKLDARLIGQLKRLNKFLLPNILVRQN